MGLWDFDHMSVTMTTAREHEDLGFSVSCV